jgi:type IV pilus assembly protein PilQ
MQANFKELKRLSEKHIRKFGMGAIKKILLVILLGNVSVAWSSVALTGLDFAALPGDQVEISLTFDGAPPEPEGYVIEKPARISLTFDDVSNKLKSKQHALGVGSARSLTVVEAQGRSRVIIAMDRLLPYRTRKEGNKLFITVGQNESQQVLAQQSSTSGEVGGLAYSGGASGEGSVARPVAGLQNIDFVRGEQGEGQVVLMLSDSSVEVDMHEENGKIVVELVDMGLADALRRRLDVKDFATPVQYIDAIEEDGSTKLLIEATGHYEYLAYQTDKTLTVNVKPVSQRELEKNRKDVFMYTGEKLSLNFQDIEVRSVLQLIADFTSLNLVASDTVSGGITLRLKNVPWDQALELILKTKGLDKRLVGNVMLVAPADEIAAREKLELEANKQVEELAPLRSEFVQINYAKAADIQAILTGESGLMTPRGKLIVDERTNNILLNETASKIEEIRDVIAVLDVPVKQVLIEARIVVANEDFTNELGVAWGGAGADAQSLNRRNIIGGSNDTLIQLADNDTVTNPQDLVVDLGVTAAGATSLALGVISTASGLLELELSALEAEGSGEIVSTPKVLTADQQKARISSGTEIPYQEASSSGATSVSFKEAVLSLEVTPQITPDDSIIMNIKINKDAVGELVGNSQIPSVDKNEIETTVLVGNGETVVLGGIFSMESFENEIRTPFFGNLPIIGFLFRKQVVIDEKQELLVFITPKVVENVLSR